MEATAFSLYHTAVIAAALGLAVADYRRRAIRRIYWTPLIALGAYNAFQTTVLLLAIGLGFSALVGVALSVFGGGLADWWALFIFPFVAPTVWPIALAGGLAIGLGFVWVQLYEADDVPFLTALFPALALTLIFLPV